jgi:hypothetical protein
LLLVDGGLFGGGVNVFRVERRGSQLRVRVIVLVAASYYL